MFGINDPGILFAYLMAAGSVVFALWFGITRWNRDEKDSNQPPKTPQS